MSYGLRIYNESGYVQIDDTYSNFTVIASGSGASAQEITFPAQARPPLVLISPASDGQPLVRWSLQTSSFQVRGGSFSYKVLVPTSDIGAGAESYGLRVYNASGGICFDSGREQFRVLKSVTFVPTSLTSEVYIDVPAGSGTYCFTLNSSQIYEIEENPQLATMYAVVVTRTAATQFRASIAAVGSIPNEAVFSLNGNPVTVVIGTWV